MYKQTQKIGTPSKLNPDQESVATNLPQEITEGRKEHTLTEGPPREEAPPWKNTLLLEDPITSWCEQQQSCRERKYDKKYRAQKIITDFKQFMSILEYYKLLCLLWLQTSKPNWK